MKFWRTLLLALLLPALLLPAGTSICLCKLLHVHAASACATCQETCCPSNAPEHGSSDVSAVKRDCFLRIADSDPARVDHARFDVVTHGDAVVADLPPDFAPRALSHGAPLSFVVLDRRLPATPLFSSALPLRL